MRPAPDADLPPDRLRGRRIPALLPERLRAHRAPRWWEEALVVLVAYWLYGLVRNGVPTHEAGALQRARDVLAVERWLHIDAEHAVNTAAAGVRWLIVTANYYYATLHFIVTVALLVWLFRRRPQHYRSVRSVLFATNFIALAGFYLFPLAPPRMLGGEGYVDTVVVFHTWGSWASGDVADASNQFAAMPSLHFAWALWCGLVLGRLSGRRLLRMLGVLYPAATLLVIVATANHFVLDAVGGAVVLGLGFGVQRLLSGRPAFAPAPAPAAAPRAGAAAQAGQSPAPLPVPRRGDERVGAPGA